MIQKKPQTLHLCVEIQMTLSAIAIAEVQLNFDNRERHAVIDSFAHIKAT